VSGDNDTRGYDEPTDMKRALIQDGVPADKVYCDYAGFRSLDSIVRAKKVFGQERVTIVSQRFHNERCLYLAQSSGLDAVAFNAAGIRFEWALKTYIREAFARVKAVLDVNLLGVGPKFLGPAVSLDEPPRDA
jgi:SanA protein